MDFCYKFCRNCPLGRLAAIIIDILCCQSFDMGIQHLFIFLSVLFASGVTDRLWCMIAYLPGSFSLYFSNSSNRISDVLGFRFMTSYFSFNLFVVICTCFSFLPLCARGKLRLSWMSFLYLSRLITKATKLFGRPAKTQLSLGIRLVDQSLRWVHEETSGP